MTDFTFCEPISLQHLLANLPNGVSLVEGSSKSWDEGARYESCVLKGPSYAESGQCFLYVTARDGVVYWLTRYNVNKPTRLLETLSDHFKVRIVCELGFDLHDPVFLNMYG
jgi:hypothetical protein